MKNEKWIRSCEGIMKGNGMEWKRRSERRDEFCHMEIIIVGPQSDREFVPYCRLHPRGRCCTYGRVLGEAWDRWCGAGPVCCSVWVWHLQPRELPMAAAPPPAISVARTLLLGWKLWYTRWWFGGWNSCSYCADIVLKVLFCGEIFWLWWCDDLGVVIRVTVKMLFRRYHVYARNSCT